MCIGVMLSAEWKEGVFLWLKAVTMENANLDYSNIIPPHFQLKLALGHSILLEHWVVMVLAFERQSYWACLCSSPLILCAFQEAEHCPFRAPSQYVLWLLGISKLKGPVIPRTRATPASLHGSYHRLPWALRRLWRISEDLASQSPHLPSFRDLGMVTQVPSWSQKQTWNLTLIRCGLQNWIPANSGDWTLKGVTWLDFLLGQVQETFHK